MRKIVFLVFFVVLYISCQKETFQPIEQGIYEAYQQGFSEIIIVTKSSYAGIEDIVVFKNMEEGFKFPSIFDDINTEEGKPISDYYSWSPVGVIYYVYVSELNKFPLEYSLTVKENWEATLIVKRPSSLSLMSPLGYNIRKNCDQLRLLLSIEDGTYVRFSPKLLRLSTSNFLIYDESLIVTSKDKDYEKYTTVNGEMQGENLILYFYDARINRGSSYSSQTDINYLDIDLIREEMNESDVFEFVRKVIYFKKKE